MSKIFPISTCDPPSVITLFVSSESCFVKLIFFNSFACFFLATIQYWRERCDSCFPSMWKANVTLARRDNMFSLKLWHSAAPWQSGKIKMCKMKQTHYIRCLIVNNTFHDQLPVSFCGSLFSEDQVLCSTNVQSQSHGIYTEPTKENYTGVETTPFWNYFFCRFLLRLSENNHSRVMFIAKFGSTASDFGYKILIIFGVEIGAFVRPHVWSWTGFDLLTISGVKFWWFSFFLLPL